MHIYMYTKHYMALYTKVLFDQVAAQDKGGRLCFTPPASFFTNGFMGRMLRTGEATPSQYFCTGLTYPTVIKCSKVYICRYSHINSHVQQLM